MRDNKLISWTAFALFLLAVALLVTPIITSAIGQRMVSSEGALWAAGGVALLAVITGLVGIKTGGGKIAALGGVLVLLLVVLVTPAGLGLVGW